MANNRMWLVCRSDKHPLDTFMLAKHFGGPWETRFESPELDGWLERHFDAQCPEEGIRLEYHHWQPEPTSTQVCYLNGCTFGYGHDGLHSTEGPWPQIIASRRPATQ